MNLKQLSKTTTNYADRRNVDMFEMDGEMSFTADDENNECTSVVYLIDNDILTFLRKFDDGLDDLPAHITNEKQLREVIDYIALSK